MQIDQLSLAVRDTLAASITIRDWCQITYNKRCILQYGEDNMDLLTSDDAPWIVVCPTETEERPQSHDTIGMVALAVGINNPGRTETSLALDVRTYDGLAEAIEFARLVRAEALQTDFGCSYTKTDDTDFLSVNKYPLFLALTGIILVEPEIVARAEAWRSTT